MVARFLLPQQQLGQIPDARCEPSDVGRDDSKAAPPLGATSSNQKGSMCGYSLMAVPSRLAL